MLHRTRTWALFLLFLLTIGNTACAQLPSIPFLSTPVPATTNVEDFSAKLILTLLERNYSQLEQMMGDPFIIAAWQSAGAAYPRASAITQLRDNVLSDQARLAFTTSTDFSALLGGTDPLAIWGPDVNAQKAIHMTGLGQQGTDEAILIIAQRGDGTFYWHGLILAAGGFAAQAAPMDLNMPMTMTMPTTMPTISATLAPAVVATRTVTATAGQASSENAATTAAPTAAPTIAATQPPTATPLAPAGASLVVPTAVREVLVLQNLNVRNGPGQQYQPIAVVDRGEVVQVVGVSPDSAWWNIVCPNKQPGNCWITADPTLSRPQTDQLFGATPTFPAVPSNPQAPGIEPTSVQPTIEPATRIQFAPGATSATVDGQVNFPARTDYLVAASAGQEMQVEIVSAEAEANFAIRGVQDGQPYKQLENEDRSFTFTLPSTQDYLLSVASPGKRGAFQLVVTVVNATGSQPEQQPIPIQFGLGETAAEYGGRLAAGATQEFILRAAAYQNMTISSSGDVLLAVTGADGTPYKRFSVGGPSFALSLPETQDYFISVQAAGPATNYAMTVSVE